MLDIVLDLRGGKRLQLAAAEDDLFDLAESGLLQRVQQSGLAEQHYLQQAIFVRLQIRQHPHVLENLRRQMVRIVQDDQRPRLQRTRPSRKRASVRSNA